MATTSANHSPAIRTPIRMPHTPSSRVRSLTIFSKECNQKGITSSTAKDGFQAGQTAKSPSGHRVQSLSLQRHGRRRFFGFRQHFADIRHALASLSTPSRLYPSIPVLLSPSYPRCHTRDVRPHPSHTSPACTATMPLGGNTVAHVSRADNWRFCAPCLERLLRRGRILARRRSPFPRSSTRRPWQSPSQNCRLLTQRSSSRRFRRSGRNHAHQLGDRRPR